MGWVAALLEMKASLTAPCVRGVSTTLTWSIGHVQASSGLSRTRRQTIMIKEIYVQSAELDVGLSYSITLAPSWNDDVCYCVLPCAVDVHVSTCTSTTCMNNPHYQVCFLNSNAETVERKDEWSGACWGPCPDGERVIAGKSSLEHAGMRSMLWPA